MTSKQNDNSVLSPKHLLLSEQPQASQGHVSLTSPALMVGSIGKISDSTKKQRRPRTIFTKEQLEVLKEAYRQNPYPKMLERIKTADEIQTDQVTVKTWMQNRRARQKQRKKKQKDQLKILTVKKHELPVRANLADTRSYSQFDGRCGFLPVFVWPWFVPPLQCTCSLSCCFFKCLQTTTSN